MHAVGLDVSRSDYVCIFFSLTPAGVWENRTSAARAVAADKLRCTAPDWGSNFTAGHATVTVRMGSEEIQTRCDFDASSADSFRYLFLPAWDVAASGPRSISATGPSNITVRGFGFSNSKRYTCNLSSSDAEFVLDDDAHVISTTELVCSKRRLPPPEWFTSEAASGYVPIQWYSRELTKAFLRIFESEVGGGASRAVCSQDMAGATSQFACYAAIPGDLSASSCQSRGCDVVQPGDGAEYCSCGHLVKDAAGCSARLPVRDSCYQSCLRSDCSFDVTCYEPECGYDGFMGIDGVSAGSAMGGSLLTVRGFGFHGQEAYVCRFVGSEGALVQSKDFEFRSPRELVFMVPPWPYETQVVSVGLVAGRGKRQVRFVAVASSDAQSGPHASTLFYNTSIQLPFLYLPEIVSVAEPAWADRLGGQRITLQGAGFGTHHEYLCAIVSNETTDLLITDSAEAVNIFSGGGQGEASEGESDWVPLASNTYTAPNFAYSDQRLVCMPPAFDEVTLFADFSSQTTPIMLYQRAHGGNWTRVFSSRPVLLSVRQVNRPPSFVGSHLKFYGGIRQGNEIVPDFAEDIFRGADVSSNPVYTESTQQLTFDIVVLSGGEILSGNPWLFTNGTAIFPMNANKFGILVLRVSLRDDGGTADGGMDEAVQTLMVDVERQPLLEIVDDKAAEVIPAFEVHDNSQRSLLPRYRSAHLSLPFSSSNFYRRSSFNITLSTLSAFYFSSAPQVMEDGSLAFRLRPGVFGVDQIRVDIHTIDILTKATQDSSEWINISIQQVAYVLTNAGRLYSVSATALGLLFWFEMLCASNSCQS